ncbi:hypothetical protein D9M68_716290 [compost metagenome]
MASLGCKAFGKTHDGELRGAVDRHAGNALEAGDRGDVDEVPAPLGAHVGQCRLADFDQAKEVGFHLLAKLGIADLFDSAREAIAGVVDHHVDPACRLDSAGNGWLDLFLFIEVELAGEGATRGQSLELGHLFALAQGTDHHFAARQHRFCQSTAEAGGDTGNQPGTFAFGHQNHS